MMPSQKAGTAMPSRPAADTSAPSWERCRSAAWQPSGTAASTASTEAAATSGRVTTSLRPSSPVTETPFSMDWQK
ncbi:hypothetical protein AB0J63_37275 [Streptosporangium canum]|uniref:hypothetical protein n=1 Tax=Streptosporangium canum TaxID=324952 RepID=UPI00343CB54C